MNAEVLGLDNALRVKSAEYWLTLGEPLQALHELELLPPEIQMDPWVLRVWVAALGAARELHLNPSA